MSVFDMHRAYSPRNKEYMVLKKMLFSIMLSLAAFQAVPNEYDGHLGGFTASTKEMAVVALREPCVFSSRLSIPEQIREEGWGVAKRFDKDGVKQGCWLPAENYVLFVWEDGTVGWMWQHQFRRMRLA
jgi:hypothetical protein